MWASSPFSPQNPGMLWHTAWSELSRHYRCAVFSKFCWCIASSKWDPLLQRALLVPEQKKWFVFVTASTRFAFEVPVADCKSFQLPGSIVFKNICINDNVLSDSSRWTQFEISSTIKQAVRSEPTISTEVFAFSLNFFSKIDATSDNKSFWLPLVDSGGTGLWEIESANGVYLNIFVTVDWHECV